MLLSVTMCGTPVTQAKAAETAEQTAESTTEQQTTQTEAELSMPTLSGVSNTSKGVKVTWSKFSGARGYYIYRRTSGSKWKKVGTVKKSAKITYLDKTAKKGKTYFYTVQAYSGKKVSDYDETGKSIFFYGKAAKWQEAYAKFLTSYKPWNGGTAGEVKFALIYKAGKNYPYLYICNSGSHVSSIETYAYKNGKVRKIASEGAAYGTLIDYNTGKKKITIGWFNGFVYGTEKNINYILIKPSKVTIS
jgi:hypothetical protein